MDTLEDEQINPRRQTMNRPNMNSATSRCLKQSLAFTITWTLLMRLVDWKEPSALVIYVGSGLVAGVVFLALTLLLERWKRVRRKPRKPSGLIRGAVRR